MWLIIWSSDKKLFAVIKIMLEGIHNSGLMFSIYHYLDSINGQHALFFQYQVFKQIFMHLANMSLSK